MQQPPVSSSTESALRQAIEALTVPGFDEPLKALSTIRQCHIDDQCCAHVQMVFDFPIGHVEQTLNALIMRAIVAVDPQLSANVSLTSKISAHRIQTGVPSLPEVANIIAVASGKGGVGKSSIAVNLAAALSLQGARVGILDADLHGPSLPRMLGFAHGLLEDFNETQLDPIVCHNLTTLSIGMLVDADTPIIWRGPMISQVFEKMIHSTRWGKLDYLIIDMPPGTGDIQITLAQKVPLVGVLMVTTPQTVAIDDVARCIKMFEKVHVPILGVVENMSGYACPQCHSETPLFGAGGSDILKQRYNTDVLAHIPIDPMIVSDSEKGQPTVIAQPNSGTAKHYHEMALSVALRIAKMAKDNSVKFPKIVVEQPKRNPS